MSDDANASSRYTPYIEQALATEGGHLTIGRGGFSLHFGQGARLTGDDIETIKAECIAVGLPVIDSLGVEFDRVADIVVRGPIVAVGCDPDPQPWRALSFVPLRHVATSYAAAGAEIWNMPDIAANPDRTEEPIR
jgi:hypothetical protein